MNWPEAVVILFALLAMAMTFDTYLKHKERVEGIDDPLNGGVLMPLDAVDLDGSWEIMQEDEAGRCGWIRFTPKHFLASEAHQSGLYVVVREAKR